MKKVKSKFRVILNKKPTKKWVKRANSWAVTEFKDGKQIITWHDKEPQTLV